MITYSRIQKSQLECAHRLDAEYYQPEYLQIQNELSSSPPLSSVSRKITDFGAYSQMNFVQYTDSGARFFRNCDVQEAFVDSSEPIFVSMETYKKLSLKLKEYDIVIPRVGTLGNAAVISAESLPATANQNLAQIEPDIKKIDPFYLAIFLCSRFGKKQFERLATGNVQPWLNLKQINSLKIFVPSYNEQLTIRNCALQALKQYQDSKIFYSQAENLLLGELRLKDFEAENDLSYIINLSDVKSAHRADAEYFQPKYERFISKVKGQNAKLLKELVSRIKTKIKPKTEEIYKYIEISDINIGNGDAGFNEIVGKELPASARIPIKGGEFLISKVRPTRGAITILSEDSNKNFICSGAFSVFKAPEILKEYLFVVLRSIIGKLQFEKPTTGTSYPTITDEDVENTLVPILPKPTQQKIAELVRKSHTARKKAKELLEQAKQKVEELIEQGV